MQGTDAPQRTVVVVVVFVVYVDDKFVVVLVLLDVVLVDVDALLVAAVLDEQIARVVMVVELDAHGMLEVVVGPKVVVVVELMDDVVELVEGAPVLAKLLY
jgi:hypothetical protein